ncbi:MAG TPA: hypothetical protein VFE46_14265 [Pirellulales bacterium]|nr:hypothetical protein [Pirellulales bacterium]
MKPTRKKLSELRAITQPGVDVFVCSASYEVRCRSVADNIDAFRVGKTLIAMNENHSQMVGENHKYLAHLFNGRHDTLYLDTEDPIKSADSILRGVRAACSGPSKRWLIDITTFTHEGLLILFRILSETVRPDDKVDFVYAHAKEYSVGDPAERKWLSKGIREVRSVLGFPGELLPSRRTHLIVLAGFETERALALIQEYEPTLIAIGCGDPTEEGTRGHQQTNEAVVSRLRHLIGNIREFVFPCYDADGTMAALKQEAESIEGYNTIIAPMNTKISTIGAGCYALENGRVQICYGQANMYNFRAYSEPGEDCYYFSVNGIPKRA